MSIEAAIVMIVVLAGLSFFFLLLPLGVVLTRLRAVWRERRGTAILLAGLVVLTGFFFVVLFIGLAGVVFGGGR
jgi:hypothetical protein